MGGISTTDVDDLGWFRIGITRHRDSLQTARGASDPMISHTVQVDNCVRCLMLGSFHSRPGGQFGTFGDKSDCIGWIPGEVAQALNRAVVAQEGEQADGQVAEERHDLGRVAGVDAAGILGEVDIAHPMQPVLDAPVATVDGGQAFGIGLGRVRLVMPKPTLALRAPVRLSMRWRSMRKTCCRPPQPQ